MLLLTRLKRYRKGTVGHFYSRDDHSSKRKMVNLEVIESFDVDVVVLAGVNAKS